MVDVLSTVQFLAALTPLAKDLAEGTMTEAEFNTAAAPIYDGYLLGDARVARFVKTVTETNEYENRLSSAVVDWYTGTATGGPLGDGRYPIPGANGVEALYPSPALLAQVMEKGDPGRDARHGFSFFAQYTFGPDEIFNAYKLTVAETYDVSKCAAWAMNPSTAPAVIRVYKNGAAWGTIAFAAGAAGGVFTISNPTVAAGDLLTFLAPSSPDATLGFIAFTFSGAGNP